MINTKDLSVSIWTVYTLENIKQSYRNSVVNKSIFAMSTLKSVKQLVDNSFQKPQDQAVECFQDYIGQGNRSRLNKRHTI